MFFGLASLISALTGFLGGSIPRLFDIVDKRMTFAQEMKVREFDMKFRESEHKMQLALAEKQVDGRIQESYYEALAAEQAANREAMAAIVVEAMKPTGYGVIDAVNASLRPFFFLTTMVLFFLVVAQVALSTPEALAAQAAAQFWLAVEASVGFLVGYRSVVKPPATTPR